MRQIRSLWGREILDSRGFPTLEVDIILEDGSTGRASVPAGASTGTHEAIEKRDGDTSRYQGKGVQKALQGLREELAPALKGWDVADQQALDSFLIHCDGTPDKSRLGANTLLAVSLAAAKAYTAFRRQPLYRTLGKSTSYTLPTPLINILNGGAHADNSLAIQEFMIVPLNMVSFKESLDQAAEVFHALKGLLKKGGYATSVGDEGGFAPQLSSTHQALDMMMEALHETGLISHIGIALDAAASEFYHEGFYHLEGKKDAQQMVDFYAHLADTYPLISLEDGLAEDDWEGWRSLTEKLGQKIQLVGDDLFVTNVTRLKKGVHEQCANAILIKVNQIGTLSEAAETIEYAYAQGYRTIMSHRSGETEDTTIADLAVAYGCEQIKTGSLSRGERTAKYNQLIRIEEELQTHKCP